MLVSCPVAAPGPENNGAGGKGRLGLPPYLELGVPGLGLPFRSARSYCEPATEGGAGGLARAGDQGLRGDAGRDEYCGTSTAETAGGGIDGTFPRLEAGRDGDSPAL
jgi:hypothetical protein